MTRSRRNQNNNHSSGFLLLEDTRLKSLRNGLNTHARKNRTIIHLAKLHILSTKKSTQIECCSIIKNANQDSLKYAQDIILSRIKIEQRQKEIEAIEKAYEAAYNNMVEEITTCKER